MGRPSLCNCYCVEESTSTSSSSIPSGFVGAICECCEGTRLIDFRIEITSATDRYVNIPLWFGSVTGPFLVSSLLCDEFPAGESCLVPFSGMNGVQGHVQSPCHFQDYQEIGGGLACVIDPYEFCFNLAYRPNPMYNIPQTAEVKLQVYYEFSLTCSPDFGVIANLHIRAVPRLLYISTCTEEPVLFGADSGGDFRWHYNLNVPPDSYALNFPKIDCSRPRDLPLVEIGADTPAGVLPDRIRVWT